MKIKNQPKNLRDKATEIANVVLKSTGNEGEPSPPALSRHANILKTILMIFRKASTRQDNRKISNILPVRLLGSEI